MSLAGKVALLTGAGRGIGLEIARTLVGAGCAVAIQDVELDVATREAKTISNAIALGGDISDLSLPSTLVKQTIEQLGGLHILINNAGIQLERDWISEDRQSFDRTFHGNVLAALMLCQ